jgi:hypothetical protein
MMVDPPSGARPAANEIRETFSPGQPAGGVSLRDRERHPPPASA